jgi:RNA-binding protein YlmH
MNDYLSKLARNEDEKFLVARLEQLVQKAAQGLAGCSVFLDLRQQELARAVAVNALDIGWHMDGGYEEAERKRLLVFPEWVEEAEARIAWLRIRHHEFQEQALGHRDYLGAILNLGLKREKIGDIVVQNGEAVLLADIDLADFICQQLSRVKHSRVRVETMSAEEFVFQPGEQKLILATLASLRLDAAIAAAFHLSRSDVDALIESGNVKINQLQANKCAVPVKAGDLISVRGWGRCRLDEVGPTTRKGRHHVRFLV